MKNTFIYTLIIMLVTLPIFTFGQSKQIEFQEYDLPNGLHVILHQDNTTPIVVVSVLYHVGSKNENPNRTGFAHFFEHLMFEGSKNIERGDYSKYVEKAGGVLNAYTNTDKTYFYELLPSNQLELGLWLESERMLHLKVDSIGIKTQKNVVVEEKKQNYDNRPYGSVLIEIMKRAYKVHPYQWTTIGDENHIKGATDEDFNNFYKTYYVPNNATVTIAGDIKMDDAKALVAKYFGDIPRGQKEIYRPDPNIEPKKTAEIRDTVYDNIQLPAVIQAYNIPSIKEEDFYAVDMLNRVLSRGQSSRMYKALVDEQQKAMTIFSFSFPSEHPGVALVYGLPNMGVDLADLEKAIDEQVEKVKNELISDSELQKLKNQIETEMVTQNATLANRADNLATSYTFLRNTNFINTEAEHYLKVTAEDIKRVANKYFVKENRVVLYYLPKNQSR